MPEGTPIDRAKYRSIGHLSRGRTRDRVTEGRDADGNQFKATTDQLGHTVTQRAGDRQDVTINAPRVTSRAAVNEEG